VTTTRPALIILALIIALLLLLAIGLLVTGLVVNHRARQLGPDHPGATATTPTLPPDAPTLVTPIPFPLFEPANPPRPVGRHHEETVVRVPPTWMPATGAARIRALEETRLDLDRPGGVA
jgi:hypothetical protein